MNEHNEHMHIITVTPEESAQLESVMQHMSETLAATRAVFDSLQNLQTFTARESLLVAATMADLNAMEKVMRAFTDLFLRAKCEVIQ